MFFILFKFDVIQAHISHRSHKVSSIGIEIGDAAALLIM
jgi:hypothetical protein